MNESHKEKLLDKLSDMRAMSQALFITMGGCDEESVGHQPLVDILNKIKEIEKLIKEEK